MYEVPVFKISTGGQTPEKIKERLSVYDQIIDLYEAALITAGNEGTTTIIEYELHTGQTKQRVKYGTPEEIMRSLKMLQHLRDSLSAKLSPRTMRLIPDNSFKNRT